MTRRGSRVLRKAHRMLERGLTKIRWKLWNEITDPRHQALTCPTAFPARRSPPLSSSARTDHVQQPTTTKARTQLPLLAITEKEQGVCCLPRRVLVDTQQDHASTSHRPHGPCKQDGHVARSRLSTILGVSCEERRVDDDCRHGCRDPHSL